MSAVTIRTSIGIDDQQHCLSRQPQGVTLELSCIAKNAHWKMISHFDYNTHQHWFNIVDPANPSSCIDISGSGDPILSMYRCGDSQSNQMFSFKQHQMRSASNACVGKGQQSGLVGHECEHGTKILHIDVVSVIDEEIKSSSKRLKASLPFTKITAGTIDRLDKMAELDRVNDGGVPHLALLRNKSEDSMSKNVLVMMAVILLIINYYYCSSSSSRNKQNNMHTGTCTTLGTASVETCSARENNHRQKRRL